MEIYMYEMEIRITPSQLEASVSSWASIIIKTHWVHELFSIEADFWFLFESKRENWRKKSKLLSEIKWNSLFESMEKEWLFQPTSEEEKVWFV